MVMLLYQTIAQCITENQDGACRLRLETSGSAENSISVPQSNAVWESDWCTSSPFRCYRKLPRKMTQNEIWIWKKATPKISALHAGFYWACPHPMDAANETRHCNQGEDILRSRRHGSAAPQVAGNVRNDEMGMTWE